MNVTRRAATFGGLGLLGATMGRAGRADAGEWLGGRAEGLTLAAAEAMAFEAYGGCCELAE